MKKNIIIYVIFILSIGASAQTQIHVDERFELTSVVFRLTEDEAFVHSTPANYIADIDDYFSPYKNHELIEFVKKTMYAKSILDISLPVQLASDVEITTKGIVWTNNWTPLFEQYDTLSANRIWTRPERDEYLRLLNKFYKDTRFHKFYVSHGDFYAAIETAFDSVVSKIDTSWFREFFGIPYQMDNLWLVPANGYHNFSIHRFDQNNREHNNCALGGVQTTSTGKPSFHPNTFGTLIHEICHNYSNPLCVKHEILFAEVCDTLYSMVGEPLRKHYYSQSTSLLYEGINRLCEFSYHISHSTYGDIELREKIVDQIYTGFVWFEEMLCYMNVFNANRDKFPAFEDFLPQLKMFLDQVTENMEHYYYPKYDLLIPRVVATYPVKNSVVETDLKEVRIQFSKPMQHVRSINSVEGKDILSLPVDWQNTYWYNDYVYVIPLKEPLKPHTKYGFKTTSFFADALNYFGALPYELIFETK